MRTGSHGKRVIKVLIEMIMSLIADVQSHENDLRLEKEERTDRVSSSRKQKHAIEPGVDLQGSSLKDRQATWEQAEMEM